MSAAPEFIRVIDTNGREHFIHPTTIADAHVTQDSGAQPHVEIVTTARNTNPNLGDRPQSVHVSGAEAEQLLAELRRRAGVADESSARDTRPARLKKTTHQPLFG